MSVNSGSYNFTELKMSSSDVLSDQYFIHCHIAENDYIKKNQNSYLFFACRLTIYQTHSNQQILNDLSLDCYCLISK